MGSGASSSVERIENGDSNGKDCDGIIESKSASLEKERNTRKRQGSLTKPTRTFHHKGDAKISPAYNEVSPELNRYQELLGAAEDRAKSAEEKAQDIESQMAELEVQKLELMDQVSQLEQHVESLQLTANIDDWSNTLQAKEKYIEYLEGQAQKAELQITALKKKYQKKLRFLKRQLSEMKQTESVTSLEQQQERQNLIEENNRLKDQLRRLPKDAGVGENDIRDSRTKIILELSSRVSEQDSQIGDLEVIVDEKESEIQSLKEKLKELKELGANKTRSERSATPTSSLVPTKAQLNHGGDDLKKTFTGLTGDDEMLNELKTLTDEMKDMWNKEAKGEVDYRQSSGVSRDSGIMTTGHGMAGGSNKSGDSDWADSDTEMDANDKYISRELPSSGVCEDRLSNETTHSHRNDGQGDADLAQRTILDPISIRQISAAKLRKRTRLHPKPPTHKANFRFDSELDHSIISSDNMAVKRSEPLQAL